MPHGRRSRSLRCGRESAHSPPSHLFSFFLNYLVSVVSAGPARSPDAGAIQPRHRAAGHHHFRGMLIQILHSPLWALLAPYRPQNRSRPARASQGTSPTASCAEPGRIALTSCYRFTACRFSIRSVSIGAQILQGMASAPPESAWSSRCHCAPGIRP